MYAYLSRNFSEVKFWKPLNLQALAENLAVTKVSEIVFDDRAIWLLSLTEGNFGIKQRCQNFLEELYHPYTNPESVATLIRQCILGIYGSMFNYRKRKNLIRDRGFVSSGREEM